jgi:hypothetical protein
MSLPRTLRPRSERSDTKTLVRLGRDGVSEPEPAVAPAQAEAPVHEKPTRELSDGTAPALRGGASSDDGTAPALRGGASLPADAGSQRSVQLWFKGVAAPVRARAELGDARLQLKAALPFLELESIVGVSTQEGGALLHGRIRRVAFEQGTDRLVPQLCVDVSLSDSIPPPSGFPAFVEPAEPARAAEDASAAPARAAPRPGRILGWLAVLAVGAACGAGVAILWLAPRFAIEEPQPAARADRSDRSDGEAQAPPAPAADVATVLQMPYAPAFDVAGHVEAAAPQSDLIADAPVAYFDLLPETDRRDDAPANDPHALAAEDVLLPDERAPGADDGAQRAAGTQPEVTVEGVRTRVFVPMHGDGFGLRQYELTTPGVAVTLPNARALIPIDNYAIHRGIVRRVWLRQEPDGLQVRVITRRASSRAITSFDGSGLTILLDP